MPFSSNVFCPHGCYSFRIVVLLFCVFIPRLPGGMPQGDALMCALGRSLPHEANACNLMLSAGPLPQLWKRDL